MWNKSLSQRWRRIRRRCSSFTTNTATHADSPETHLQKQFLLDTSGSSVESPRVICADAPSPLRGSKDADEASTKCGADDNDGSAAANGLADVSHLLRAKFNKFQNGFRKRRAMSVHESISAKDGHQTTFYVPTPLDGHADEDEETDEVDSGPPLPPLPSSLDARRAASPLAHGEPLSLPALARIPPCSRVSYRKSPSECSSGRGTATPTEELDNDSSGGSNHSSKSFRFRKHSYEERLERSSSYWDQGYHSIEYSPENIPYRYGRCSSGRASKGEPQPAQPSVDEPASNGSLFRDQCSMPSTSIRLSSKCERVPTSRYVYNATAYRVPPNDVHSKYRNSCVYSYDNYRGSDFEGAPNAARYQNRREAVSNYDGRAPSATPSDCESNGLNYALRVNGHPAVVRRAHPGERLAPTGPQAAPPRSSASRFNVSDSSVDLRRRPINVHDIDEDDFDEELMLRNEPKTRSCRRWSQADTLAMDPATAARPHPLVNGFRIGERVTTCQLPYAALQSIEPLSMPYNPAPPIPTPPKCADKTPPSASKTAAANLRRRSARSVSPESRKKETEAREKRQQIVQNLQKYVDQRCRNMVGCKSNADLSNASENDFWKKEEDTREKVSGLKIVLIKGTRYFAVNSFRRTYSTNLASYPCLRLF